MTEGTPSANTAAREAVARGDWMDLAQAILLPKATVS
jgi:hypothetical protein